MSCYCVLWHGIAQVPLYGWYHANWYRVAGLVQLVLCKMVRIKSCKFHCADRIAQIAVKLHPANCPVGSHRVDWHGIASCGLLWDCTVWIASWDGSVRMAVCGWQCADCMARTVPRHRADCIVASCGLHRVDSIVRILTCGFQSVDSVVWVPSCAFHHFHREIGGVYGRYLPGYWGIRDPIIILLLEVEGKALFGY